MNGMKQSVEPVTGINRKMLDLYTDYLISSFSYITATGLSAAVDHDVSHDEVTRFLSDREYTGKDLWQLVKPTIRQIETRDGVIILDDTIEEKQYTDENEIITWHYDHTFGRNVKGVNILNCLYHNDQGTVPIGFDIVKKDIVGIDEKTGKQKRTSSITKNEMARNLIGSAVNSRIEFGHVLADSWFSSQENMEFVVKKKKHFIFAIKSNRTMALSKEDKYKGIFQAVDSLTWETGTMKTGYLKGMDMTIAVTRQVFTNEDGSSGQLFLATSDITLDYTGITTTYQKRWKVEEYHKSIKSNLGLAMSPTKTVRTQTNHFFAAMFAYHKLERLSNSVKINHFALKTKLYVKALQTSMSELQSLKETAALA